MTTIEAMVQTHLPGEFYLYDIDGMACGHCDAAKGMIELLNLPLCVRHMDRDVAKQMGIATVPQIYLGHRHLGGRRDLELFLNEMGMLTLFKPLRKGLNLPKRGSAEAAGMDLYADFVPLMVQQEFPESIAYIGDNSVAVKPLARVVIPTGWSLMVPKGTYGRVAPRSGLAVKVGVDTLAGVIDRDYRGELKVCLINLGTEMWEIKNGDRIAQLVLEKIVTKDGVEVAELPDTERGAGGYGSTGR